MSDGCEHHVRLSELPRGVRRRCVQFAIAMTWLAFCALLLFVARWAWDVARPPDNQAVAALALIASAMGIGHGIHAGLELQNTKSGEFVSEPTAFYFISLALSVLLLIAGCYVTTATAG